MASMLSHPIVKKLMRDLPMGSPAWRAAYLAAVPRGEIAHLEFANWIGERYARCKQLGLPVETVEENEIRILRSKVHRRMMASRRRPATARRPAVRPCQIPTRG